MSIEDAAPNLADRVDAFEAIFDSDSLDEVIDFLPPKLKNELFESAGGEAAVRDEMQQVWDDTLETVVLEKFDLDDDANEIQTTESGAYYKIIPTRTTVSLRADPNQIFESTSETLAMTDQNTWYLVRLVEPQQVEMFRRAYPEFASIEVAPESMTQRERSETE